MFFTLDLVFGLTEPWGKTRASRAEDSDTCVSNDSQGRIRIWSDVATIGRGNKKFCLSAICLQDQNVLAHQWGQSQRIRLPVNVPAWDPQGLGFKGCWPYCLSRNRSRSRSVQRIVLYKTQVHGAHVVPRLPTRTQLLKQSWILSGDRASGLNRNHFAFDFAKSRNGMDMFVVLPGPQHAISRASKLQCPRKIRLVDGREHQLIRQVYSSGVKTIGLTSRGT